MKKITIFFNWAERFLWPIVQVGFLLAIIFVSLLIISQKFSFGGNKLLVVTSGSMQSAIGAGSLVLVTPMREILSPIGENLKNLEVGDVITFKKNNNPNVLVTHRVNSVTVKDNQTLVETKGDANNVPDMEKVQTESIVGKVLFAIPFLGFPVAFAKTIPGYLLMIIIPALAIIFSEIWTVKGEIEKYYAKKFAANIPSDGVPRTKRFFKRLGKSLAAFLIFSSVSLVILGGTRGMFQDQEKIEGNSVSTWTEGDGDGGGKNGNQILICHQTGSETNPWEELTIPQNAWPAHERHGDILGPCSLSTDGLTLTSLTDLTGTEEEISPTPTPEPTVTPTPTPEPNGDEQGGEGDSQILE